MVLRMKLKLSVFRYTIIEWDNIMSEDLEFKIIDNLIYLSSMGTVTWKKSSRQYSQFDSETIYYSKYNEIHYSLSPYFSLFSFRTKYLLEIKNDECTFKLTYDQRNYPKIKQLVEIVLNKLKINIVSTRNKNEEIVLNRLKSK